MNSVSFQDYSLFAPLFSRSDTNSKIVLKTFEIVPSIAVYLCKKAFDIDLELVEDSIFNQKNYDDTVISIQGKIDDRLANILVMCRIDDNIGISHGDMIRLYNTVVEERSGEHVYFILISRFFEQSIVVEDEVRLLPRSINEFKQFKGSVAYPDKVTHIGWLDWYNVTIPHRHYIPEEIRHMLLLQKEWIKVKNRRYFLEYAFTPTQEPD